MLNQVVSKALTRPGRLERFGVTEHFCDETTDTSRCLTDGHNWLWVGANENGFACFVRFRSNGVPDRIVAAVEATFDTVIASEYSLQMWFSWIIDELDDRLPPAPPR